MKAPNTLLFDVWLIKQLQIHSGGYRFNLFNPTIDLTYVALKLRGLLEVKLLWCVRNQMVVTLTLLKFLLVAVLRGNFQSSNTAQYSTREIKRCVCLEFSPALCVTVLDRGKK